MQTSTIPTIKARLVALIDAALTVPVTYAWPGPDTAPECVFLGPHPATADLRIDVSSQIATVKAGRKQRQEEYTVRVTVWTFRPELTSADAQICEERAFALAVAVENILADDPKLGLAVIQYAEVSSVASTLFPFMSGWACELSVDVAVKARLT